MDERQVINLFDQILDCKEEVQSIFNGSITNICSDYVQISCYYRDIDDIISTFKDISDLRERRDSNDHLVAKHWFDYNDNLWYLEVNNENAIDLNEHTISIIQNIMEEIAQLEHSFKEHDMKINMDKHTAVIFINASLEAKWKNLPFLIKKYEHYVYKNNSELEVRVIK